MLSILEQIYSQYDALDPQDQDRVEILLLSDNKKMVLGQKRNYLVDMAQGNYYVFVDDDDRIEPDYIRSLLDAIKSGADVVTFMASVSIDRGIPKPCVYSKDFDCDHNTEKTYNRLPNHICCVKREVGRQVSFPNIQRGEDSAYSKLLKPLLKTQHYIPRVLYHYDFNRDTTETQECLKKEAIVRRDVAPIVDVIIVSNASTNRLERLTRQTIHTCLSGANGLSTNIIVIEQNSNVRYENIKTVYRSDRFNYNRYANAGAKLGSAPWIMIANNDLVFSDGWLHHLLSADHQVVSPKCPVASRQTEIKENTTGTLNSKHFSGWCFMMDRKLWQQIGGFDEDVTFWFSDDCTIEQVGQYGIEPMLVPSSVVRHLGSTTLNTLKRTDIDDYTWRQVDIFNTKYNRDKFVDHPGYIKWKSRQKEGI